MERKISEIKSKIASSLITIAPVAHQPWLNIVLDIHV